MRRRIVLLCCCVVPVLCSGAPPASAALEIVAPATGLAGEKYEITVRGTGPFDARVRFHAEAGTTCTPQSADWEHASGPFRHTFEFARAVPGPWALCARLVSADDADEAPGYELATAVIQLTPAQRSLTLAPARPVYALGEPVDVLVQGFTDVTTYVYAWARALDGPPCADAPWIGDQTYSGPIRGDAGARVRLDPITVAGTYRICAHLHDAGGPEVRGVLETQLIVSQACADAKQLRHRRTASYRRARAAYRRARGARRARLRRVMLRRQGAMDRARARVRSDC